MTGATIALLIFHGVIVYICGLSYTAGRLTRYFVEPLTGGEQWGVFWGSLFWPVLALAMVLKRYVRPPAIAVWRTIMLPYTRLYRRGLGEGSVSLPKAQAVERDRQARAERREREMNSGGW